MEEERMEEEEMGDASRVRRGYRGYPGLVREPSVRQDLVISDPFSQPLGTHPEIPMMSFLRSYSFLRDV